MTPELDYQELALLMKKSAGITVDPDELENRTQAKFSDFGLDSLGLLGIVGELENRHGRALPPDADKCKSPAEFIDMVNDALLMGA
ncbi:acyl carrier protein [Streptomyces sp. NPDC051320]|uniref:acyl carrier protein n=1 Tax=unclassified Streptomyces TaxID=2593676 RepID=UPI003415166B